MASGPITSWELDGETGAEFIFLGSKITADGVCSHEIKGSLLFGSRVMTNLDSILKSRDSMGEGVLIWEPREIKSDTVSLSISHEMMGPMP